MPRFRMIVLLKLLILLNNFHKITKDNDIVRKLFDKVNYFFNLKYFLFQTYQKIFFYKIFKKTVIKFAVVKTIIF